MGNFVSFLVTFRKEKKNCGEKCKYEGVGKNRVTWVKASAA